MLYMFIFIFILNIFLILCGLGVSISTLNLTSFFYTLFCKVVLIRIVVTLVISAYTKQFSLNSFSLSVSSVIFIFILAGINFYYIIPLVKFIIGLGLTNATNMFNRISLFIENTGGKNSNSESLAKGLNKILTKLPLLGRYLKSTVKGLIVDNSKNRSSPFRINPKYLIRNIMPVYPLIKLSRFTTIFIPQIVSGEWKASFEYKGTLTELAIIFNSNRVYLTDVISKFICKHSNLQCKVKILCNNSIVNLNANFNKGILQEFNLSKVYLEPVEQWNKNFSSENSLNNKTFFSKGCHNDLNRYDRFGFLFDYNPLGFLYNYNQMPPFDDNDLVVFAHNYSTTPSEVNKEELPSSDLDILPEEPTDLVDSNTNDNESSSISEKSSQFWSNNPSSSGKNTIDTFEKINNKKRETGAFFTEKEFEDYITPYFKSCRSIKDLNIITEDFLLDLKSNINRFLREVREDIARTLSTYDESVMETNETIRLNYQKITDQQTDPEQLAALTNHNTFLLNYLTGVTNIRDQLMDYLNNYLNSWDIDEGDNYRSRSSLVHSLYDTHTHRIIDLHNGFDWYASEPEGSEPEGSEPEGSEPEGSEPEGSETDDYNLNEEEDTKNTSDKGKHRCTENVSDKGKGKSKMTECIDSPSDSDPQDEMDRGV